MSKVYWLLDYKTNTSSRRTVVESERSVDVCDLTVRVAGRHQGRDVDGRLPVGGDVRGAADGGHQGHDGGGRHRHGLGRLVHLWTSCLR